MQTSKGKKVIYSTIATLILWTMIGCGQKDKMGIVERINKLDKENQLIVQLAELQIDSAQIEPYLEFLKEEIQKSVEIESGVITLYSMQSKEDPTKITLVEIYENLKAYESHIASEHFLKYKNGTLNMVDSLKLTRVNPVIFASKE